MKFVTFNIRCDFGQDGANNFIYRRPLILEKIRQEKPDIIGFQEVLPHVAAWLNNDHCLSERTFSECEPGNLLAVTDTVRAGIPLSGTEYVPAYCDGCGI